MRAKNIRVEQASGNVFANLGLPNPDQEVLKAHLTLQIYRIVKARGLTQAQAGDILGIKQPHVSALMRNRAGNFSVGRLMEFLTALGQDVRITVKPTRKAKGEMAWWRGEQARVGLSRTKSNEVRKSVDGGLAIVDE
jgi:predicted XRE-type DNA-binding protein